MNSFELVYKTLKFLTGFLPLKNIIILESNPDLSDNTYAVYNELIRRGLNKKYKLVWFLNREKSVYDISLPKNVILQNRAAGSKVSKLKFVFDLSRARFIIDSNSYVKKMHNRQIRIHLKHGLPMKDASNYNHDIGSVDLIPVPGEYWVDVCAKEHGVSPSVVKPLGFARNDVLSPKEHKGKTVIWMPTYRSHTNNSYDNFDFKKNMPLGLPFIKSIEDLKSINELFMRNGAYLLVRLHPAQKIDDTALSEMSNIKLCNDDFLRGHNTTLYSVLAYTDALVSDYSSIYYDYLNLSKPIALAVSDFELYKKNNGILAKDKEEFKVTYPAQFLESFEDLTAFFNGIFNDDPSVYKCAQAKEKYMGAHSNNSAERTVDYMVENFGL